MPKSSKKSNKKRDFLSLEDWSPAEVKNLLSLSQKLKAERSKKGKKALSKPLAGKTLAMIFEKPSNRTLVSFDVAMHELGGHAIELSADSVRIGERETVSDVAKTLSRYVDAILIRTYEHTIAEELAYESAVPIINGLTDTYHPCQALADLLTIWEREKTFKNIHLVYLGDGNNVSHSLINAAAKTGLKLTLCHPKGYASDSDILKAAQKLNPNIKVEIDGISAVKKADYLYTDVWTSMGQEEETRRRMTVFKPFQINTKLLKMAPKHCKVMHCLPAHRGQEITDEVLSSDACIVFDQAENRLHVQKAVLATLLR